MKCNSVSLNEITVELTEDVNLINSILDNPKIYQMVNGTPYTKPINGSYREELTQKGFKFLSVCMNQAVVGVFSYREITSKCVEAHIHMLPEVHKKGYGKQAVIEGLLWFSHFTSCETIITYVPSNCFHVLKFMQDNDFTACGSIPKAVIYNNELVNLFIFERGLQ